MDFGLRKTALDRIQWYRRTVFLESACNYFLASLRCIQTFDLVSALPLLEGPVSEETTSQKTTTVL